MSEESWREPVYLFHVTFEENLSDIIEKQLIPGGENVEDSEGKISVFAEWGKLTPYLEYLKEKGERSATGGNYKYPKKVIPT